MNGRHLWGVLQIRPNHILMKNITSCSYNTSDKNHFVLDICPSFPKAQYVYLKLQVRQDGAIKPSGFSGNQRFFFSANWHCVNWTWIILLFMRTSAFCPSRVSQLFACVPVLHGHLFLSLFWTAEIIKHKNYSFLLPSGCILMVCQLQGKICQVKPPDDLGSDHPYLP